MSGLGEGLPRTAGRIWREALPVWAGLMVLLGLTLGGAYLPLGAWNLPLALGIAIAKSALVVIFFMQLKRPDPLLRLAAATALIFVAFMGLLTFSDVLMRPSLTQPATVTPQSLGRFPVTGGSAFP